ncbi:MAG: hypothetical protein WBF06_14560 [Candidatus Acidiferrales bacterium]
MRNQRRRKTRAETELRTRFDPFPGAKDGRDFSKQLGGCDGGILQRKRIASGDQTRDLMIIRPNHHAMGDEPAIASEKHDIAWKDVADLLATNQEEIAGPHGRKHAKTPDFQPQSPGRSQNLFRQFALRGVSSFKFGVIDRHRALAHSRALAR